MKKINCFFLLCSLLILAACQKEEYEVLTNEDQNAITTNSGTYDLVFRSAMYDGTEDDEIDNSPCFSIEFPFTVSVRGVAVEIASEAERNALISGLPGNIPFNPGNLHFPLTIRNAAHQRVEIMNRQQFVRLQQDCRNSINERGRRITCVQLVFPVRVFSYERGSQQTGSTVLTSKEELYIYLENLTASSVMSFEFPVEVKRNNRNISVPSQSRLVEMLRECED